MSRSYDVVVAGGGIAGLSAALAAARLGCRTLVLAGDVPGGNLLSIEKVEGYPGFPEGVAGYDLCPIAQTMAAEAGAELETQPLVRVEGEAPALRLFASTDEFAGKSLIVATGASPKALGVPGEERLKGRGVSHCASCDGPLLRDAVVVVIGGGDSAMQESLTLAAFASRVIVLCRGEALGGQASYRSRVLAHPKIEVRFNAEVEEIIGSEGVSGVRLRGAAQPLDARAVFPYIGLEPNTVFLAGRLALDGAGRIPTDAAMATASAGIFAAGLARAGSPGRAIASAGEGAMAAAAAHAYLRGGKAS
ncbi:MAG TPA: FAD-dependent oxidoreductase [Burkholderiales bacterium]|nr:FAD-dependent oxidoreductase [Burkholderiales bacterium]